MNNEKYNQIVDEVYKYYLEKYKQDKTSGIIYYTDPLQYRPYTEEEFINKIKTDSKFSERFRLKINERELSLQERTNLLEDRSDNKKDFYDRNSKLIIEEKYVLDESKIPTKLITITYNNETFGDNNEQQ